MKFGDRNKIAKSEKSPLLGRSVVRGISGDCHFVPQMTMKALIPQQGVCLSFVVRSLAVCCCCQVASVVSDSVQPHRWKSTRFLRPWDSPGKNTGVGFHFLLQCMKVKRESEVAQLCLTLSDPMDCSPSGSSVHGIFQARVLEWGAIALEPALKAKHRK